VRGETVFSGYILEEDKGNVVMTLVNINSDLKGNIPGCFRNGTAPKMVVGWWRS